MHTHIHKYTHTCTCTCTCTCTRTHTCTHTHTQKHTHTQTHLHMHILSLTHTYRIRYRYAQTHTHAHACRQTDRQTDRNMNTPTYLDVARIGLIKGRPSATRVELGSCRKQRRSAARTRKVPITCSEEGHSMRSCVGGNMWEGGCMCACVSGEGGPAG